MEQVRGVYSKHIFNYVDIKGDTGWKSLQILPNGLHRSTFSGPLVYPAGFVWVYALLALVIGWQPELMTVETSPKSDGNATRAAQYNSVRQLCARCIPELFLRH